MSKAKRWKPNQGEEYYIFSVTVSTGDKMYKFNFHRNRWIGSPLDRAHYRLGNCFQTKEEAEAVACKLKRFWKDVRDGRL